MRIRHAQFRTLIRWLTLVVLLVTAAYQEGNIQAILFDAEQAQMSVFAGIWEVSKEKGTTISAKNSAEGYLEETDAGYAYGMRGEVCVTNNEARSTEGLSILTILQVKSDHGQFQDYLSSTVDISEKPVIEPGETYCYAYNIPFEPISEDKVKYRNLVNVTILNHSGWLPEDNHCDGPDPCPFGPSSKADFNLPEPAEPVIPITTLNAKQTVSGYIETIDGEAYYGAKGEVCVTNEGAYETQGLGIYAILEIQVGDKYVEKASRTLNTNEQPALASGMSHCYELELSFPDPDENVVEPRVVTSVTISNHTDWMPGDASCPGPEACYYGPILVTNFETPKVESEVIPVTGEKLTPEPGTSLLVTETATGFVEEREGSVVSGVRGEVCVTNAGLNITEGLSILDTIQFETEASEFKELGTVQFDLSSYPALDPGEIHCYPYEILFDPQGEENTQYRNIATITIDNQTGWLPSSDNCPGEDACPFEYSVSVDFTLPANNNDPTEIIETETATPDPTETETPTPELTETETETPTPESTESEDPSLEPGETETPTPEPTETITSTPEPDETETSSPEPEETETPETTETLLEDTGE